MPVRDDILAPIAGPNPSGIDLRESNDATLSDIREARIEDPPGPRRDGDPPARVADWARVLKLANDTLATRSKDLEVAGYLTEALLHREGLAGLRNGLDVMSGLLDTFWDTVFPSVVADDEDPLFQRSGRLQWLGDRFPRLGKRNLRSDVSRGYLHDHFQNIPLNKAGHGLFKYNEARDVGSEKECGDDPRKKAARQEKIDAGKLSLEDFERAVEASDKAFYKTLVADIGATQQALTRLRAATKARFGDEAPSFDALGDELKDLGDLAGGMLAKKLEVDPDPVEVSLAPEPGAPGGSAAVETPMVEPKSADEAAQRIAQMAEYLRKFQPTNPGAFLMLRGLRWGELRASGPELDPKLLVAPPTHVRSLLKGLSLDKKWKDLLEQSERVMARPDGRGWLDLQRHVVTACEQLGSDYDRVAAAIRGELALLLRDIPSLADSTLMDDTPTANAETRRWLQEQGVWSVAGDGSDDPVPVAMPRRGGGPGASDHVFERAQELVKADQAKQAIELLMQEARRERSPRGRFLRMTQVASVMVDAKFNGPALPILDELAETISSRSLSEWEAGETVALPLSLLYQCLPEDSSRRTDLHELICKLDPVRALSLG